MQIKLINSAEAVSELWTPGIRTVMQRQIIARARVQ